MANTFSFLEITGTASAFRLSDPDCFAFAPDGIKKVSRTDSEEAFDLFFEWKETGCFAAVTMEHVTYSYGDDQDPYEVPLSWARSIERHTVAEYIEGCMGVYV